MGKLDRLTKIESLWSLWELIKGAWPFAVASLLSGGAVTHYWEILRIVAEVEGPGVYFVVGVFALSFPVAFSLGWRAINVKLGRKRRTRTERMMDLGSELLDCAQDLGFELQNRKVLSTTIRGKIIAINETLDRHGFPTVRVDELAIDKDKFIDWSIYAQFVGRLLENRHIASAKAKASEMCTEGYFSRKHQS